MMVGCSSFGGGGGNASRDPLPASDWRYPPSLSPHKSCVGNNCEKVKHKYQLKKIKLAHLTPPHKSCFMSYLEAHIIDVVKSCSQYQSPGTLQSHRPEGGEICPKLN